MFLLQIWGEAPWQSVHEHQKKAKTMAGANLTPFKIPMT